MACISGNDRVEARQRLAMAAPARAALVTRDQDYGTLNMGKVKDFLTRSRFFASRFWNSSQSNIPNIPAAKTADPFLADFFGLTGGGSVSQAEASSLPVAQACITATSQTLASVPLTLYRRGSDGSAEKATDHPLYEVLHDIANPSCTAFEAREILTASVMVSGNGYAKIRWNQKGQVIGLEPLEPHNVQ